MSAMRTDRPAQVHLVLRAGRRITREPGADAHDRRRIPGPSHLRLADDDRLAATAWRSGQSQTHPTLDAAHGTGGDLPTAADQPAVPRPQDLPVFAAKS